MGCGSSKDDARVARLLLELEESKTKASEQQNLLRFKVEVLVNMLAMEEKKGETIEKRAETLKALLHKQGVAEETLTFLLEKSNQGTGASVDESLDRSKSFRNVGLVDLAGALSRAQEEFSLYRADILPAFAEEDGKVVASLSNEEFMKQLYTVTEKLSKADIQIIALRFGDGSGYVSVPEFLEFFTTPAQVRMAKAATAAVRMSLDLLQLTADEEYLLQQGEEEEEEVAPEEGGDGKDGDELQGDDTDLKTKGFLIPQVLSSHLTANLDRGVRRLLAMWVFVKADLEQAFKVLDAPAVEGGGDQSSVDPASMGEQIVDLALFKSTLLEKCGIKSGVLGRAENEGKIVFNRTGKPIVPALTKGVSVSDSLTKSKSVNGPLAIDTSADGKGGNTKPQAAAKDDTKGSQPTPMGSRQASRNGPLVKATSSNVSALTGASVKSAGDSSSEPATPPPLPVIEPLNDADMDMLAERFELGGCVHYGHFIQYFNELHGAISLSRRKHVALPSAAAGTTASPFVISSEWQKLRASAVLKKYAAPALPAPPAPAPVAAPAAAHPVPAEATKPPVKEPKPVPAPVAEAKPVVKKGIDAADYKPNELPPPGVEVVEPASGFLCCGASRPKPSANRPEPLPVGADAKTAWDDAGAKGQDDQSEESQDKAPAEDKNHSDTSSEDENFPPKVDQKFNTPDKSKSVTKLSFQPRRVTRDVNAPEENVARTGLGKPALNDSPESDEGRPVNRRNHFHRRDE